VNHLPGYPASPQPFADTVRPQGRKQENSGGYPFRMAFDHTQCIQPSVGQRQGRPPGLDAMRHLLPLRRGLRYEPFATFGQGQ